MKDVIGVIGSGYMCGIIGKKAHESNIEVHAFGLDTNEYMLKHIDCFHKVDIFDIDKICDICLKNNVKGVIATTELTILPTSLVANRLKLIGNPVEVSKNITDKYWVRQVLSNKDIIFKQPEYYIYDSNLNLQVLTSYPYIVKPDSAGGKRGITVVNNLSELKEALNVAIDYSRNNKVLIEQYIDGGKEYSIEGLSFNSTHYMIQVTQKVSSGWPHCVELAHHQPANISEQMKNKIQYGLSQILNCVGIKNGPTHTEIKIVDGNIYLIEINARPGGDHIAYPLTELSTNYDYILGIIHVSLDKLEPINTKKFANHYSGVCFITTQTKQLKQLFDNCQRYKWLYKKNEVSSNLQELIHNDGFNINYFIYYDKDGVPSEIKRRI